jgi:hypothetical protein
MKGSETNFLHFTTKLLEKAFKDQQGMISYLLPTLLHPYICPFSTFLSFSSLSPISFSSLST